MSKPNVPVIVAVFSAVNQTTDLPQTPIFTPDSDGNFRVSLYTEFATGSVVDDVLDWTDDFGSRQFVTPRPNISTVLLLRLKANQPLSLHTNSVQPITYSVFATVEDMN